MTDPGSLRSAFDDAKPDEVYNLAAQSHVAASFRLAAYTAEANAIGAMRVFEECIRWRDLDCPDLRVYQASTSEMFGDCEAPQHERTPFCPRSPYAAAKVFAHEMAATYRQWHNLHLSCGILFNHESVRRGETFVTRKVTRAVGRIAHHLQDRLLLGRSDTRRDWGWAPDYVAAMRKMLGKDTPGDYVIATGVSYSVEDLVELAGAAAGIDPHRYVTYSHRAYVRPTDIQELRGDSGRARMALGWQPTIDFETMIRQMVEHDLELAQREANGLAVPRETDQWHSRATASV